MNEKGVLPATLPHTIACLMLLHCHTRPVSSCLSPEPNAAPASAQPFVRMLAGIPHAVPEDDDEATTARMPSPGTAASCAYPSREACAAPAVSDTSSHSAGSERIGGCRDSSTSRSSATANEEDAAPAGAATQRREVEGGTLGQPYREAHPCTISSPPTSVSSVSTSGGDDSAASQRDASQGLPPQAAQPHRPARRRADGQLAGGKASCTEGASPARDDSLATCAEPHNVAALDACGLPGAEADVAAGDGCKELSESDGDRAMEAKGRDPSPTAVFRVLLAEDDTEATTMASEEDAGDMPPGQLRMGIAPRNVHAVTSGGGRYCVHRKEGKTSVCLGIKGRGRKAESSAVVWRGPHPTAPSPLLPRLPHTRA